MPRVGNKNFPYTKKGKAAAKKAEGRRVGRNESPGTPRKVGKKRV